jgi:hypothetical protein
MSWTWLGSAWEAQSGRPPGRMTAWTLPPGRWCLPEYHASMASPFTLVTCSFRRSVLNSLPSGITKGVPSSPGPLQRLVQVRGAGGEHLGPLVRVPVRGRAGDAVVTAGLPGPGPVAEPPQDHDRLLAAGQRPAPGRGAPPAPLQDQQPVTKPSSSTGTPSVARPVITWSPRAEDDLW